MSKGILAVLLLFSASISISHANTFVCTYPKYATNDGLKNSKEDFVLIFVYDQNQDQYFVKGNVGAEEIAHSISNQGINFIEVTNSGNIMLTTISSGLDSVHSRHTMIPGFTDITASQYYGSCTKE
jgi:hypothetical protein